MELHDYLKFFAALVFVLSLMGGLAFFLKKIGLGQGAIVTGRKKRLKVIEVQPIDARRKLVIVGHDDKEHLVLLGPSGDTVITKDAKATAKQTNKSDDA